MSYDAEKGCVLWDSPLAEFVDAWVWPLVPILIVLLVFAFLFFLGSAARADAVKR